MITMIFYSDEDEDTHHVRMREEILFNAQIRSSVQMREGESSFAHYPTRTTHAHSHNTHHF